MADNTDWLDQMLQSALAPKQSNVLTDIGQLLGGTASGLAGGRSAESSLLLSKGALDANLFDAALKRKAMEVGLPETRAKQAVTGDLIANMQDVVPTGPAWLKDHLVNFTGGRRPSALGPNARSAGAALSNIGASNIGQDQLPAVPQSPTLPQSGVLDKLLGAAGVGSSLAGALGKNGSSAGGDLGSLIKGIGSLFHRGGSGDPGPDYGPTLADLLGDYGPTLEQLLGGSSPGNVDTTQLPGQVVDPMQEYYDWLAQQGGGGAGDEEGWGLP